MKNQHRILMVEPTYFDVKYAINPHMKTPSGELKKVDLPLAKSQWQDLKEKLSQVSKIEVLEAVPDLPDMVFAANQSFPFLHPETGKPTVLMAQMRSPLRQPEVVSFEKWFKNQGYIVEHLADKTLAFEGNGDALIHPHGKIILGGHGPRTDKKVYEEITRRWGFEILPLELRLPEFYHLDTCLTILDQDTVAVQTEAFSQEDLNRVRKVFKNVIPIDYEENMKFFAANCFCPNGRDVFLQPGPSRFIKALKDHGFTVHEAETSEFIKSGGSVFCLKMQLPD